MKFVTVAFTLAYLSSLWASVIAAKVCIFSVVGFLNHRSAYDTLVEALVENGHDVTVYSTLPLDINEKHTKKVRHLNPSAVSSHLTSFFEFVSPLKWRLKGEHHVVWDMLPILTLDLCHIILQDAETQKWLEEEKTYDLFIVDSAWNECGIGISHAFQAKLILFSFHSHLLPWNLDAFGGVPEVSSIPDPQYASIGESSNNVLYYFMNKVFLNIRSLRWHIYRNSFMFYQVRKFSRKFLNDKFPHISDLEKNASLVLVNGHFSEEYVRSLPPVFVPVGGVHIRNKSDTHTSDVLKKMPNFLGNSRTVFIVNIGCSIDLVNNLPEDTLETLTKSFERLSHVRFVVTWLGNKRSKVFSKIDNVVVLDSCSRELYKLLGRKDVKGFVTTGDLLDVQEGIFHGIPLILLPVAFEQDANSNLVHTQGRGIRLDIGSLTENIFVQALQDLISDSTYKIKMTQASQAFRDRPQKPLDSAIWWIEYSLRNSDTSALKPRGIQDNWFARRSLDAWMFIFFCLYTAIFGVVIVLIVTLFKNVISKRIVIHASFKL